MKTVHAFAPATVANVSCGFDIFGFAVEAPGDEVILTLTDKPGVTLSRIEGDEGRLPRDPARNTAGVALAAYLQALGREVGVDVVLKKHLPLGSGMGSSAASSVAALVGINRLLGDPLDKRALLPFAMEAERIACGSAHADNVGPALLGGFVLIRGYDPLDVVSIPTPAELHCTLIHPHLELNTKDSREVLRMHIPLRDAVTQWGNAAGLALGLATGDYGLISRSLKDVIVEPVRSMLIPGFEVVKERVAEQGALGSGISGSGPTMFVLSADAETARKAGEVAQAAFAEFHLQSEVFVSRINPQGATILDGAVV